MYVVPPGGRGVRTDGCAEDDGVAGEERVAEAEGAEDGGNAPDDEGRVTDDEAVGPRLVAHPPDQHAGQRVRDADDGDEEGGAVARDTGDDGEVRQVDERHEEACV